MDFDKVKRFRTLFRIVYFFNYLWFDGNDGQEFLLYGVENINRKNQSTCFMYSKTVLLSQSNSNLHFGLYLELFFSSRIFIFF